MKVLICGKGGCGKSTIVDLLSKEMAERNNKVLVIDSDESNIGLHHRLGMAKPADFMDYFGDRIEMESLAGESKCLRAKINEIDFMNSDVFVDESATESNKYEIRERK